MTLSLGSLLAGPRIFPEFSCPFLSCPVRRFRLTVALGRPHTDYSSAKWRPSTSEGRLLGGTALPSVESVAHPLLQGLHPVGSAYRGDVDATGANALEVAEVATGRRVGDVG